MRQPDENKRNKIGDAAIKLMVTIGFADTSMHRIAKEAKVAASTIYLYFENKEDMLNKLYLTVKQRFGDAVLRNFDVNMPMHEGLRVVFNNICDFFKESPEQFLFMEQFASSPLVNRVSRETATGYYRPVIDFIEKGKREKVLKNVPVELMGAYFFNPIASAMRNRRAHNKKMSKKEREAMFVMAWDAVKL
ncbi:MAG: TetR/AcrR family transcriptional regulator [Candidatus Omnitrophica bacterium]|nr:TetR/AcrR family transcriptional regulator [Candidatus Omnitrophota bacterium]